MTGNELLARFALLHVESVPQSQRPDLLAAAAQHLPREEADLCRATAQFIRHAEDHQMELFRRFGRK